jgi:hypothetical protein
MRPRGGGEGRRRRRRTTTYLSAHQPSPRATDPSDGEQNCQPMRLTPRTYCAKDHHTVCLASALTRRTFGAGATTKQSWPIGIRYAVRCKKFMRQLCNLVCLGRGTRRPGQAVERRWRMGISVEERTRGATRVRCRRRPPEDKHVERQEGEDKIRRQWF